ncbi:Flp pilus assembly complex ATPase component TadA [Patescibacteria group bacterium]|nr:Flp pilus assembly complex ATPase component TadA [Patescibacteria group bacterium]
MSASEVALFQQLISNLVSQGASDLYLRAASSPIIRLDGELKTLSDQPVVTADYLEVIVSFLLTEDQRTKFTNERQLTFGYTFANRIRLRLSLFYQKNLPELTIRFIPVKIKNIKELGLPVILEKIIKTDSGLIIISGPYASGRSATQAALIQEINNQTARHVITIEDPIEYLFVGNKSVIDQRELGNDVRSWDEALDTLPQEDCDVVFLSKVPQAKIAAKAITLAAAGKLVVIVSESDSTIKALEHLVASFLPDEQVGMRQQLGEVLLGVLSQQLVARVGGGRIAVTELLIGSPAVRSIIKEGKLYQLNNILQVSRDEGMVSFDYNLAELVKTGEIMEEEALAYSHDKELFSSFLRRS